MREDTCGGPLVSIPEVNAPEYTDEEKARLTENLRCLVEAIHIGKLRSRALHPTLLFDLHRALFDGVTGHAGRPRGPGFGSEVLRFGRRYSADRKYVARKLDELFRWIARAVDALEAAREDDAYEDQGLRVALHAHAEVIRIHPFEDGNGRSSRLLLDVLLVRLALRPVSFDTVRDEYIAVLEAAFEGDEQPMADLYIRLVSDRLE